MHSHDPNKDNLAFQAEFQWILDDAGDLLADFTGFVFPSANYSSHEFKALCLFADAKFAQDAMFEWAKFMLGADFTGVTFMKAAQFGHATFTLAASLSLVEFTETADFRFAKFMGAADFSLAKFKQTADFSYAEFAQAAVFAGARFTQAVCFKEGSFTEAADFSLAEFLQTADLLHVRFTQAAVFAEAKFTEKAIFSGASFAQRVNFSGARFTEAADFSKVTFGSMADLSAASFLGPADFHNATFAGLANFSTTRFLGDAKFVEVHFESECSFWLAELNGIADFHHAAFDDAVEFRETIILSGKNHSPAPIFALARFNTPERVVFYKTYLGRALLHNCDVSRVQFSSVQWRGRPGNEKRMVFDEVIDTENVAAAALRTEDDYRDDRNYDLIAELYQQLKKNYDDKRDYWTAGDFHYGEMEMKRLSSPRRSPVLRWLHRNVGLAAWYKYASDYGESYVKPFLRLLLMLALFTFIYPACGLHHVSGEKGSSSKPVAQTNLIATNTDEISYANLSQFLSASQNGKLRGIVRFFVQSAMTSVSVASLRRDFADYEPQSVAGRFAALIELLLTSTLVALFLLAVRRQFRR